MKIYLIALGERVPQWVNDGYRDYILRLPPDYSPKLIEIPTARRTKNANREQLLNHECERVLAAIPRDTIVWALDEHGQNWSSAELANQLANCAQQSNDLTLLIGGPEGLAPVCKDRAQKLWSLSRLTFPHFLVRVLIAEQIYRAWTILNRHPYHK